MKTRNQNPEQIARDRIDQMLSASGWLIQSKDAINFNAGEGQVIREYTTDVGPADYVLFVEGKPVGVIEAKREDLGQNITTVEDQTKGYAHAKLKWVNKKEPLPFQYEATGALTRFTDARDPRPRAREIFSFHRPETLRNMLTEGSALRQRLQNMPPLAPDRLRDCQINAVQNLEKSLNLNKPRALIQMATGSGKTYTAITSIYRLLKFAKAKRILFLVDTKNLGEQAEQEFMAYVPNDDNRKFTELYTVQRLRSSYVASDSQVCISTIQRMYSILKGEELDEAAEEDNPAEHTPYFKEPLPVVYNERLPIEFFDFIVIDECHRSIYNLWQQVLDYFDSFLIGLTATPDNRTFGFFKNNVVSEYTHEQAVADGVNVGNEVYIIETEITNQGAELKARQLVERREKLTRARRWEQQDEDEAYSAKQLDKDIVNPDQIRTVIRTFRDKLTEIFPGRDEIPKTLIFAKTDSHADDIIHIVREEFGEGNQFCKKITYKNEEDPKSAKTHYVIVDSIGVTKSLKTASQPLITKPSIPLRDLAMSIIMGASDTDTVSSLAGRLARLEKQIDAEESARIADETGQPLRSLIKALFDAIDADRIEARALEIAGQPPGTDPGDAYRKQAQSELVKAAAMPLTGKLINLVDEIRRVHDQTIDYDNLDTVLRAEWDQDAQQNAQQLTQEFAAFLEANKDTLTALTIFYDQPYRRREVTFKMVKDVLDLLKANAPKLAPLSIWKAYAQLEDLKSKQPANELTALVALIRRVTGIDAQLTPFGDTVRRNFQNWIMQRHAGTPIKFTEAQLQWLQYIRDHVCTSLRFEQEDLDYAPFDAQGGLGKMHQLFGEQKDSLIEELNGALVA